VHLYIDELNEKTTKLRLYVPGPINSPNHQPSFLLLPNFPAGSNAPFVGYVVCF